VSPILRSIGWSFYATSSWTWCIGLFLPVILMQWFGWYGFLLITIPNCIGAAAMGILLGSPEESRRFVQRHRMTMWWFVMITVAFHLFFLSMIGMWFAPQEWAGSWWWLPVAALVAGLLIASLPHSAWPWLGTVAAMAGIYVVLNTCDQGQQPGWSGTRTIEDLLWLAPVFIIEFLLCPWLDAPFHHARQQTRGSLTFLLLGIFFLCMLLVTASYFWLQPNTIAPTVVLIWLIGQSIFTIGANLRQSRAMRLHTSRFFTLFIIVMLALGPVLALQQQNWDGSLDLYLRWLSAYGIIFPAILIASARRKLQPPQRLWAAVMIVAAALVGEVGFIHGPTWLCAVAALIAMSTCLIPRRRG